MSTLNLNADQLAAMGKFKNFIEHPTQKEFVLSGSPGRGKSWLTQQFVSEVYTNYYGMDVLPTATTGKAAGVLGVFLGTESNTVHSALGIRPSYNPRIDKHILVQAREFYKSVTNTLLIVDEASGVSPELRRLIDGSLIGCKTLFVGDKRQLVGIGETSACVFDTPEVFAELTIGERFASNGHIAALGQHMENTIDTGVFKPLPVDGKVVQYINGEQFEELVNKHYTRDLINTNHAKIVCWSNYTVRGYNDHIRNLYTASEEFTAGEILVSNDTVMSQNAKIILNTEDVVVVESTSPLTEKLGIVGWNILLTDGCTVFQPREHFRVRVEYERLRRNRKFFEANALKEQMADLRPLHASTAHKAQGSTYDVTFVNLDDIGQCHCWITVARMLNVAFTRATDKVYLYGKLPERYTNMTHLLPSNNPINF